MMRKSPVLLDLHDKVLIVRSYMAGFCEKLLEDFPKPDGANSNCSKRDLLLDKDQPTGNNGSALGKSPAQLQLEEKGEKNRSKVKHGRRGWVGLRCFKI